MSTPIGSGFRAADGRPGYLLRQAHQAMHGAIERQVRELDLTAPQFSLLSALRHEPNVSVTELAENSMLSQQTCSEMLRLLERKALVERSKDPRDRRVGRLNLTPDGRRRLSAADERVRKVEELAFRDLSQPEREELGRWLVECAQRLDDDRRSQPRRVRRSARRTSSGA